MNARWQAYFNVWPVVQRNCAKGTRRSPSIYWLRVGAGAGLADGAVCTRASMQTSRRWANFFLGFIMC